METVFCEIDFDSKPISEFGCKIETHLKVAVSSENKCKKG